MAALWLAPVSPLALWRADAALSSGDALSAVEQYDAIAEYNPIDSLRRDALYRGAMVWSVDLRDAREARLRWQAYADLAPDNLQASEAFEQIGRLYLAEQSPQEAARLYRLAYEVAPDDPRGVDRLQSAARALEASGQADAALETWEQVFAISTEHRSVALMRQAEIRLSLGDPTEALSLYDRAVTLAMDDHQDALARLGVASCLERLGNLDEAIAELDQTDLSGDARDRRMKGLRARRQGGDSP